MSSSSKPKLSLMERIERDFGSDEPMDTADNSYNLNQEPNPSNAMEQDVVEPSPSRMDPSIVSSSGGENYHPVTSNDKADSDEELDRVFNMANVKTAEQATETQLLPLQVSNVGSSSACSNHNSAPLSQEPGTSRMPADNSVDSKPVATAKPKRSKYDTPIRQRIFLPRLAKKTLFNTPNKQDTLTGVRRPARLQRTPRNHNDNNNNAASEVPVREPNRAKAAKVRGERASTSASNRSRKSSSSSSA